MGLGLVAGPGDGRAASMSWSRPTTYSLGVDGHLIDDPAVLTRRAQTFLGDHARREAPGQGAGEQYVCTDPDGSEVDGPDGGQAHLQAFVARYGGLAFCPERPGCDGKHSQLYRLDAAAVSGWARTGSGAWVSEIGEVHGWPLMLDHATGRIGLDIHGPETWIAESLPNLVESAALGQSIYLSKRWRKAVPVRSNGPGWVLDRLLGRVPEVAEASSPWNRWLQDGDVAVHGWQATYEPTRSVTAIAWYRTPAGRQRIEAAVGPLAA